MKNELSDLHLQYIDAKSALGLAVDKSKLFQLSQDVNREILTMDPLTDDNIQTHPFGALICSDIDESQPALGYAACKRLMNPGLIDGKPPTSESTGAFGYIGGLLLDPSIRGHHLAPGLIEYVTERTFATIQEVDACIASCNAAGLAVFGKVGYRPMDPNQQVFSPSPGFKAMIITREQFVKAFGGASLFKH